MTRPTENCVAVAPSKLDPVPDYVTTSANYRQALLAIRPNLTDKMLAMLTFQYRAPESTATASELARVLGYDKHHPANRQYGELGRLIAEVINFTPPKRADGKHRYWSTLSTGDPAREGSENGQFAMRPEPAAAIAEPGWA